MIALRAAAVLLATSCGLLAGDSPPPASGGAAAKAPGDRAGDAPAQLPLRDSAEGPAAADSGKAKSGKAPGEDAGKAAPAPGKASKGDSGASAKPPAPKKAGAVPATGPAGTGPATGPAGAGPGTPGSAPPGPPRPAPKLKSPQADEKFQDALKKLDSADYEAARAAFLVLQKDAAGAADRKLLQGYADDARLAMEIEGAKGMVEKKEERKAIARLEKAIRAYPTSVFVPRAEKLIHEAEEVIYLVLDDFEPGDALQKEGGKDPSPDDKGTKASSSRFSSNMTFNGDARFIHHGKGSMKWRTTRYYYSTLYYGDGYGYRSPEMKNPITKWRSLVFWVYLPEAEDGSLRVVMSERSDDSVLAGLYTKKFIELRGKKGWMEVRLDLNRDFGGTNQLKLEDVHYIHINNMHLKARTLYLDFIHLE